MASHVGFNACCGALIWYGFYNSREDVIETELKEIENKTKGQRGISVLIIASDRHKYYAPLLEKRKGWEKFCHGATNPVHGNMTSLYGYAYSASVPPKKKTVSKRKSVFGLTRKVK